jgi:3-isopropylmalate/(R)-2-methylmalate dehydratase large subunit
MDHNVPTGDRSLPVANELSAKQMEALAKNTTESLVTLFDLYDPNQGIVHIIGPELGLTVPGITLACGDSHTTTHGAFGALAFPIGSTEVEHVFATQSLWVKKPKLMDVKIEGDLLEGVSSKDIILWIIRKIGTGGGIGYAMEYTGDAVRELSVEGRMTVTNMSVEAGARTAIIAPDEKVYRYIKGAPYSPRDSDWEDAMSYWKSLSTDPGSRYDTTLEFDVSSRTPGHVGNESGNDCGCHGTDSKSDRF